MPIDAAAKIKLIHDEALKIRNSSDAGLEARNFIKAHPELFQDEQSLSEFALQLEENGVLPGIDLRNTPGAPAGTLTREQLQQLSNAAPSGAWPPAMRDRARPPETPAPLAPAPDRHPDGTGLQARSAPADRAGCPTG